ncbi:unnamed protein product [Effrenium voratum]|uniref:Uncharacterized protein n=1 Tax=Effrenium voratum TaxID=2562239 RepID=A0AA36IAL5_9DINO|nr:unnamed protein product [Effrenium voratum]
MLSGTKSSTPATRLTAALRSLAAKVTRDAGGFSRECGFFHGKLSRLLNHKCKAAEPRLPAQVRRRRATAALAVAARQVTGAGAAADEAAARGSEESPLAPVLAEMVASKRPAARRLQSLDLTTPPRAMPWACCMAECPARAGDFENVGYTLQLVAKQAAAGEQFLLASLSGHSSPAELVSVFSALLVSWDVFCAPCTLSQKVAQVLQDVCSRPLAYRVMPASCPQADGGVCHILCRGKRRGFKFLTATGMWRCEAATYSCKAHGGFRWNLPVGASSAGATLVGDVMGDWIVHSSFWPPIWQKLLATESHVALERHVRRQVGSAVFLALAEHPGASSLPHCDKGEIHRHLLQHCSQTPDAVTLKNWLLSFMSAQMSLEDVAALAAEVVASHGAICCFDFSSSDGARTVFKRRTFMMKLRPST